MRLSLLPTLMVSLWAVHSHGETGKGDPPLPAGALVRLGSGGGRHDDRVLAMAFSPDGKLLASGAGHLHRLRLWEVPSGKSLGTLEFPTPGRVTGLHFSPDGQFLVAKLYDGYLCLFDMTTRLPLHTLAVQQRAVSPAAFSPDGKLLAAVTRHRVKDKATWQWSTNLVVWETATGKEFARCTDATAAKAIGFSPDGKQVALISTEGPLQLWDIATGQKVRQAGSPGGQKDFSALDPQGRNIAWGDGDGSVYVADIATGKDVGKLGGPAQQWGAPLLAADGKTVVVRYREGSIHCWDALSGKVVSKFQGPPVPVTEGAMALAGNGQWLALADGLNVIRMWDVARGQEANPADGHRTAITSVGFFPDGRRLVTGSQESVILWDAASGKELRRFDGLRRGQYRSELAFAPNNQSLVYTNIDKVRHWDLVADKELASWERSWVRAVSPDLGWLVSDTGAPRAHVVVRDARTGEQRFQADTLIQFLSSRIFSPNSKQVAVAGLGSCRVYETASGTLLHSFRLPRNGRIATMAFSPDGRCLLIGDSQDGRVHLWELASNQPRRQWQAQASRPGRSTETLALAFSCDGKRLATGGSDASVALWDVVSGQELGRFQGHQGEVNALAFSPDGQRLASAGADSTSLIWDLSGLKTGPRQTDRTAEELERLWTDLASSDAPTAYAAFGDLVTAPGQLVDLVRKQLPPARVDARQVAAWLKDLDSDQFAVREQAGVELEKLGELIEADLRAALQGQPTLEARRRLEGLLDTLRSSNASLPRLRVLRAVEALEYVSGSDAIRVLESLASGNAGALVTRQAREALDRLKRKPSGQ